MVYFYNIIYTYGGVAVERLFLSVLNMSLTASFVMAAIMLARLPLKKAPKGISYALWALAGFRLVFPFSFESVFSLIPFKSAPIPADIAMQPIPRVDSGVHIVDNVVSSVLPAATPTASVNPVQVWLTVGAYLWLAGIAVMLIYSVVSIVLLKRWLNGAKLVEDNIYKTNNLRTPFVLGLFRPKIYIPTGLTEEENGYIILHERTHILRHDHVVKFLAYFILCLHWFNPLAWAAFLLMGADMEMSCDERVLKETGGETKKAYSMSLLSLAAERRIIGGSPLAFGEGNIKERIKNVLNFKKPAAWVLIISVLAVILSSVCLLTNPALKLELSDATSVLSMEMEQINEGTSIGRTTVTDSEDIKTVLSALSGARKTLAQSVNDYPTQKNYLVVRLVLEREEKTLCLYTQGNGYYVEEPYIGVYKYKSDRETNVAIYKIYNDRLSAATRSLEPLTLANVRELARKGDNLDFEDFKDFKGADFSSNFNYRIMGYGVEGGYRLIVRTDGKQIDSANLESTWESGGSGIDIRYSDVDEFIKGHPSSDALTSDEARAVAEVDYPTATEIRDAGEEAITQPTFTFASYVFEIKLPGGETERIAVAKRNGIIFRYSDGRWLVPSDLRAYTESTSLGWENVEKGTPHEVVLKIMGEPDFALSGLYGDGYVLEDGSRVVFYYGADELVYEIKRLDEPWELLGNADVDRDGLKESIYLDQSQRDNGFVTLRIYDSSGNDIWSEQASTSHAGWTSLFLSEQGGKYYLLRYLPGMWQGYCTYTYTLFTLEGGAEHVVRSNTIEFDVNGVNKLDAPDMIAFVEEVNALLGKSTLLLSSEGGDYSFGPSSADRFFERYSWLDETPELYADGDDLKTRLVKYSDYAVSNHK